MKVGFLVVLTSLALTRAAVHFPQNRMMHQIRQYVAGSSPYIFLPAPNGRSQSVLQGLEFIEGNYDDFDHEDEELDDDVEDVTEDVDDDDDDEDFIDEGKLPDNSEEEENNEDDNDELDNIMNFYLNLRKSYGQIKNAKKMPKRVSSQRATATRIMIPDEVIEIEAKSFIDEKSGKVALLLPQDILDSIPDGSVVALMRNTAASADSEGRASRVIVRRRRKNGRRTVANKRRNNYRRRNVIVVRRGHARKGHQRRNNRRRIYL